MADLAGINGQRETFRVVGKPNLPGRYSYAMAIGLAKYGADYIVPDMLHAKYLRSPYANARIVNIDTSKAKKIPGVIEILTWEDDDIKNLKIQIIGAPNPILGDTADQEGAEVGAIVVAETEEICEEALRQLDVKWKILPHILEINEVRKTDFPSTLQNSKQQWVGEKEAPKVNITPSNKNIGDVEAGFREADHIIEFDMNISPFSGHIPTRLGSVAWWFDDALLGEGKNLHIEGVPWNHDKIVSAYSIPPEKVFQQCMFMGGRYCDWGIRKSQLITPLLAKRTGRPVRCINERTHQYDLNLNQRFMHLKVGFKKNGLITAIDDATVADGGAPQGTSLFASMFDQITGPYFTTKCRNVRQKMDIVNSNRGMMYSGGQHSPMNWDSITITNNLIAEKLNEDPMDIARKNLHGPDSWDDPDHVPSFEACIKAAKKMMGWKWHSAGKKILPDGRMHGTSFRYQMCPRRGDKFYSYKLELRKGVVYMDTRTPIIGNFLLEANMMVVAEELGLNFEDIKGELDHHENYGPYITGSDGSTGSGWVVKECANKLKKQILESAIEEADNSPVTGPPASFGAAPLPNPFKGLKPEDLDIQDGKIIVKKSGKGLPLKDAVKANLFATYSGKPPKSAWNYLGEKLDTMNVAMCETAVDIETGQVEILRFGVVADTGKIMRRTSLESQIHQVMMFSEGCQLFEDFIYDKKTGVKLNTNMLEYKKPTILDHAPVDMDLLETRLGDGAYGGSGISHSLANTHLVITAIYNAIGKWVDPPATPDKVLKALGKG